MPPLQAHPLLVSETGRRGGRPLFISDTHTLDSFSRCFRGEVSYTRVVGPCAGMDTVIEMTGQNNGTATVAAQPTDAQHRLSNGSFVGYRDLGPTTSTVSLIIPVRNEARNIGWVLEQIPKRIDEIILIDGNSTDATLITARSCRPDIKIVQQSGPGKGSALRTGFAAATSDMIVMMDADGSMAPQEITHFLHFLENGYDFVKGSRFMGGGGSLDITRFRRLGNYGLLAFFNSLYRTELTDLCYGFCAFHRRYLDLLDLQATGFEIEAEMTVRAVQAGLRIAEVPSLEMPRRTGHSNLNAISDGRRVLRTVWQARGGKRPAAIRPDGNNRGAAQASSGHPAG